MTAPNALTELDADYGELMDAATVSADREACEWPQLRRAILARGGIGPSRDWPRDAYPADLYRAHGAAPDIIAAEVTLGGSDTPPWASVEDGNLTPGDGAMFAYVQHAYAVWQRVAGRERAQVKHRAAPVVATPATQRAPGTRSFAELVADLKRRHGADVDLSGLRSEYVRAYETGERVTVQQAGREYRGTVGATRGPRPRFVLLLSLDL